MELFSSEELTKRTKAVFTSLGCNYDNTTDKNTFSQCVEGLNPQSILNGTDDYSKSLPASNPTFQLVLDGIEFKETIKSSIKNNRLNKANILAGYTSG